VEDLRNSEVQKVKFMSIYEGMICKMAADTRQGDISKFPYILGSILYISMGIIFLDKEKVTSRNIKLD